MATVRKGTRRKDREAGFARTIKSEVATQANLFLSDHAYRRDFGSYAVWVNRRRVGPDASINRGDLVTIAPRTAPKRLPRGPIRDQLLRPGREERLDAMFNRWIIEDSSSEDPGIFEEFKRSINETRARENRPPVYT